MIHSRPRLSTLENLLAETIPTPSPGGLDPAVTSRVCDYIEGQLDEKIRLDGLAALGGAFDRPFCSGIPAVSGVPPHTYLSRRRLEHVEHLFHAT
jgi:AraC family transcriptional regulator